MPKLFLAVILTAAFAAATASGATEGAMYPWWCTLKATAEGNPRHYLLYGRDAWEGEAIMRCLGAVEEHSQRVSVAFHSKHSGFGADASSNLELTLTIFTDQSPRDFTFTATAAGFVQGNLMHWQVQDGRTEMIGNTPPSQSAGLEHSLRLGTWSIQSVRPEFL